MTRHHHVPEELAHTPFRGSDVVARGLLTKNQLRGPTWVRLFRDVYVRSGLESESTVRLDALRLRGCRDVICGRTAAWLHGAWRPPSGTPLPLETVTTTRRHGFESGRDVMEARGLLVTSPERTCFDLMRGRLGGIPLLRFDRRHVSSQRHAVLRDVAAARGEQPRQRLDGRDFARGPSDTRW